MSNLEDKKGYKRTHDFAPYTKANGQDVSDEFDAIQAHLDKLPELRSDGLGFAVSPVIPEPTDDNHPATYGQLKNAENSVEQNKDLVVQKAKEVSQNAQQVALDTQTTQQAKDLTVSAAQTATNKAEVATEKADIATQKANSITESATLSEQAKQSALISESNAKKWAVNPEDNAVSNGEFSAYHHAIKARKSKESAEHFSSLAESASSSASSSEQVATNKANEAISSLNQISELKTLVDQKALTAQNSATSASLSAQSAAKTLSQVSQIKQHIENDKNEIAQVEAEVLDAKRQTLDSAQSVNQSVQNVVNTIEQARLNFIENGIKGDRGETGATFKPSVSSAGVLSWTNDKGLPNPPNVIIKGPKGDVGEQGLRGQTGSDGATFTPSVLQDGTLSWSNNKGLSNPPNVNIKGPKGDRGETGPQGPAGLRGPQGAAGSNGATFKPSVSSAGVLSWTNDKGLPNPPNINIKGPKGDRGAPGPAGSGASTPTVLWSGAITLTPFDLSFSDDSSQNDILPQPINVSESVYNRMVEVAMKVKLKHSTDDTEYFEICFHGFVGAKNLKYNATGVDGTSLEGTAFGGKRVPFSFHSPIVQFYLAVDETGKILVPTLLDRSYLNNNTHFLDMMLNPKAMDFTLIKISAY